MSVVALSNSPALVSPHKPVGPYVCTTLVRDGVDYDVVIEFDARCVSPGHRGSWDDPAEGPEFEIAITGIEFDTSPLWSLTAEDIAEFGGPITDAERATLTAWFEGPGADKVYDAACDDLREYA